jgi:hypothetical protein
VNTYVLNKDDSKKLQLAENCRAWIHKAWLAGVIREGKGLAKKLEKCKSENLRLQIELADLSAKYLEKEELIGSLETKYGLDNKSKRNNRKRES